MHFGLKLSFLKKNILHSIVECWQKRKFWMQMEIALSNILVGSAGLSTQEHPMKKNWHLVNKNIGNFKSEEKAQDIENIFQQKGIWKVVTFNKEVRNINKITAVPSTSKNFDILSNKPSILTSKHNFWKPVSCIKEKLLPRSLYVLYFFPQYLTFFGFYEELCITSTHTFFKK